MFRYWKQGLLATLLVGITFFYPLLAPIRHRIDPAHFQLIQDGMTPDRVEAIFGVPEGKYGAETDATMDRFMLILMHDYHVGSRSRRNLLEVKKRLDDPSPSAIEAILELHSSPPPLDWRRVRTWTSPRGTISVGFDHENRVYLKHSSADVRVVPPWQRWWRSYVKK